MGFFSQLLKDVSGLYNVIIGGADGIRTHDLLDAIEARSQLRHGPTRSTIKCYHNNRVHAVDSLA